MNQYRLKIALRGDSPMIQRRILVTGKTSLADLHHIIQIAMGWDNDYLHSFHIYGKDGFYYKSGNKRLLRRLNLMIYNNKKLIFFSKNHFVV